jgi:hypothetical protein
MTLFERLDKLSDLEMDVELELKDIEALSREEREAIHIPGDENCGCVDCLADRLEHWRQLMDLRKMIEAEINEILEE